MTDLDGKYTLQAGDKDILVFSYLSMKTIEEPVNGRTVINVKMASDTETLGEVVVTAMGIKKTRNVSAMPSVPSVQTNW
mgnify:CR=1 FL=1